MGADTGFWARCGAGKFGAARTLRAASKALIVMTVLVALGLGPSGVLQAAAASAKGIDVSEFQGTINWSQVATSGITFAYIRAGDGTNVLDSRFQGNWSGARTSNITRGAYWYFEPSMNPAVQADMLLQQLQAVGFLQGDLVPAIDVETTNGLPGATVAANLQTMAGIVGGALGAAPAIYASPAWWDDYVSSSAFTANPLWVANWCGSCAAPAVPAGDWGGHGWAVWQYTSAGSVAGISGRVDLDQGGGPTSFPFYEPFRPAVGPVATAPAPDGTVFLYWQDPTNDHVVEGWYSRGNWNGPADLTVGQFAGAAPTYSAPAVAVTPDDTLDSVYWEGPGDHLYEAWFAGGRWNGPVDLSATLFQGAGTLGSAPTVAVTADGSTQLVFWRGVDGHLYEAWYCAGSWHGPVDWTNSAFGATALLASAPSVTVSPNGSSFVYWAGSDGHLREAWWAGGRWNGPADLTSGPLAGAGALASSPSATSTPNTSSQAVYWRAASGDLVEAWWDGMHWNGPADLTKSQFGGAAPLVSAPAAAVTPDSSQQLVFWQGPNQHLWEAWWASGRWNGPVDFTAGG